MTSAPATDIPETPGPVASPDAPQQVNFFGLTRPALVAFFAELGEQRFRAEQMMKWVYHRGVTDLDSMTDLSKALRAKLADRLSFDLPGVEREAVSVDGTRKWVIRVAGGNLVETVMIPADRGRNTLCVSSQAGCMLDCSFCSTGKQGFSGQLTTAEIIGQVYIANQRMLEIGGGRSGEPRGITNIVMMGMGEPLLNFDHVVPATELMLEDLAFGISKRRVTVSTAGVVPAIRELAKVSDVSLAISLHAAHDELRNELVPLNRKYPIAELLDACREYVAGLGERRSLTMEYTLMRGVNDSIEDARALDRVLRGVRTKINLIPFNPFPGSGYERPTPQAIHDFQTELLNRGWSTMLRTTRGEDIDAACGQLVGQVQDRTRRQARYIARLRDSDAPAEQGQHVA